MNTSSTAASSSKTIFKGRRIFINDDLTSSVREKLSNIIQANGGVIVKAREGRDPDGPRFDPKTTTHVVSAGVDFPEYPKCWEPNSMNESTKDQLLPSGACAVVSPHWVRRSVQIGQADAEGGYSAHPDAIFSGVVLCTANLSMESGLQLRAMVEAWGGRSVNTLTRDVTHLITEKRKGAKYKIVLGHWQRKKSKTPNQDQDQDLDDITHDKQILEYKYNLPLVLLPSWVEHCYRKHTTLDPLPYKFDLDDETKDPQISESYILAAHEGKREMNAFPSRNDIDHSNRNGVPLSEKILDLRGQGKTKHKDVADLGNEKNTIKGKVVLFSARIRENSRVETLKAFISQVLEAGGQVQPYPENPEETFIKQQVRNADIIICLFRDDPECRIAYQDGHKLIGTIDWLVYVIKYRRLASPFANVLHFPRPPGPAKGFPELRLTISKYAGPARTYVKKLIERLGGRFTPDLTKRNTHVLTPVKDGAKAETAIGWGLEVVNHQWLEACFVAWKLLPISASPRFTDFELPALIANSSVGSTRLDEDLITAWFHDHEQELERKEAEAIWRRKEQQDVEMKALQEQDIEAEGQGGDGDGDGDGDEEDNEGGDPNEGDLRDYVMVDTTTDLADESRNLDPNFTPKTSIKKDSSAKSAIDQENPDISSSAIHSKKRSSSPTRANGSGVGQGNEIHEVDPDDSKASTSAPAAKKKKTSGKSVKKEEIDNVSSNEASTSKASKGKGSVKRTPKSTPMEVEEEEEDEEPQEPIFYVTTGYEIKPNQQKELAKLGMTLQDSFTEQTNLLIAGKISRTEKFLRALAKGDVYIVDGTWVEAVVKSKKIKNFYDYPLVDKEGEEKFNSAVPSEKMESMRFSLKKSLQRARRHPGTLLEGHTFYFGPAFEADSAAKIMRSVVLEAGGKCPKKINWNAVASDPECHHLVATERDRKVWEKETKNLDVNGVSVWKKELISAGILRMKMDYEEDVIATLE